MMMMMMIKTTTTNEQTNKKHASLIGLRSVTDHCVGVYRSWIVVIKYVLVMHIHISCVYGTAHVCNWCGARRWKSIMHNSVYM